MFQSLYFRYEQNNILKIEIIFLGENTDELLCEGGHIYCLSATAYCN